MTVCVAAICADGTSIVGASDKMLTSGGQQFQPPERKAFQFTPSIIGMYSGNTGFLWVIMNDVLAEVRARAAADATLRFEVSEVAYLFQAFYNQAVTRLVNQNVLSRFGLTVATFRKAQRQMDKWLVRSLAEQILAYQPPAISALILGMDDWGAHIYQFENGGGYGAGDVHCRDSVGFGTIGAGDEHAETQLIRENYHPSHSLPHAMFLVYLAKKRAEIVTGVGPFTDMFYYVPKAGTPGVYQIMSTEDKTRLDTFYRQMFQSEGRAMSQALSATTAWHASLAPLPPPPSGPSGPITLGTIHDAHLSFGSSEESGGPTGPTGGPDAP